MSKRSLVGAALGMLALIQFTENAPLVKAMRLSTTPPPVGCWPSKERFFQYSLAGKRKT